MPQRTSPKKPVRRPRIQGMLRRWVAYHEAGHAAVSLALWEGNQLGVSIVPANGAMGSHARAERIPVCALPLPMQVVAQTQRAIVAMAGPLAMAREQGRASGCPDLFSWSILSAEPGDTDADHAVEALKGVQDCLDSKRTIAEFEAEVCNFVTNLLNEANVWNLVEGIAAKLMARGRLSAKGLEQLRDEHPTAHDLILAPRRLALKWAGEERSAQAHEIIATGRHSKSEAGGQNDSGT